MEYDRQKENKKALDFVRNLSRTMKPEEAVLVDALKESPQHASGEHYTFSCLVPDELRKKIEPITNKLRELEPSLVLIDPELYHLTVFWCPMDKSIEKLTSVFKEELKEEPLSFSLHGLVALPFGISLKAYPNNDTFFKVRERLYETVGQEFPLNPDGTLHERAVSTWITLGCYTQAPSRALQDYINERLDLDLGEFTPKEFGIYISNNKFLYNPKLLEAIPNGPVIR